MRHSLKTGGDAFSEKWLQELLFQHPELVTLDAMEPGAGDVVPLVRELTLPASGRSVYLDLLAVNRAGRLVLVECKLWRNPQARREVIAQILEYASLLQGWSYGDLSVQVGRKTGISHHNLLFELARTKWADLDEARFVDRIAQSLKQGGFHLIVAGDGMRTVLHKIAEHINASGLRAARFALLEIQVWKDEVGNTLVIPHVPVATEIIHHRVFVDTNGAILNLTRTTSLLSKLSRRPLIRTAWPSRSQIGTFGSVSLIRLRLIIRIKQCPSRRQQLGAYTAV